MVSGSTVHTKAARFVPAHNKMRRNCTWVFQFYSAILNGGKVNFRNVEPTCTAPSHQLNYCMYICIDFVICKKVSVSHQQMQCDHSRHCLHGVQQIRAGVSPSRSQWVYLKMSKQKGRWLSVLMVNRSQCRRCESSSPAELWFCATETKRCYPVQIKRHFYTFAANKTLMERFALDLIGVEFAVWVWSSDSWTKTMSSTAALSPRLMLPIRHMYNFARRWVGKAVWWQFKTSHPHTGFASPKH